MASVRSTLWPAYTPPRFPKSLVPVSQWASYGSFESLAFAHYPRCSSSGFFETFYAIRPSLPFTVLYVRAVVAVAYLSLFVAYTIFQILHTVFSIIWMSATVIVSRVSQGNRCNGALARLVHVFAPCFYSLPYSTITRRPIRPHSQCSLVLCFSASS